jgi:nucleoside-diphosphate-sugar epimerase
MNIPSASQKRLVIVGATGMVGGYALRYALEDPTVGTVTSIGRKKIGISHPKLREIVHPDFADCSALAGTLLGQDAAVFCLGTYTGSVSDAELRKITVDYTVEFARVLHGSSPGADFSFLSGMVPTRPDEADCPSPATRERPRMRYLPPDSPTFTSSGPRISTRSSPERNRTSTTACCAQSIPRFACSFPTW